METEWQYGMETDSSSSMEWRQTVAAVWNGDRHSSNMEWRQSSSMEWRQSSSMEWRQTVAVLNREGHSNRVEMWERGYQMV